MSLAQGVGADAVRAHLEFRQGIHARRRRDFPQAEAHQTRALAAARRGGDRKMEAQALNALGSVDLSQGRSQQAEDHDRAAFALAQAIGYRPVLALAERGLGNVESFNGHPAEAIRHYEASLALARSCSNRNLAGGVLNSIGNTYLDQASYGKAFAYCQEALRTLADDKAEMANTLNNLGIITSQDNPDLGNAYFQRALRIAEETGDDYVHTRVINNLGTAYQEGGRYEEAEKYFLLALHLAEKAGDREAASGHWYNLATNDQKLGRFRRADSEYRQSLALAEALGEKSLIAQALAGMADLEWAQKNFASAVTLADKAAAVALESGGQDTFLRARACAGLALQALGRTREAERAFDEAIATVEAVRSEAAGGELGRGGVLETRLAPYQGRVELAAERGDAAQALEHAERMKGRILLETLQAGPASLASPLTAQEHATEERLRERLGDLNARVLHARETPPAVLAEREQARRDLETFTLNLYAARTGLRLRRADLPAWRLADARHCWPIPEPPCSNMPSSTTGPTCGP